METKKMQNVLVTGAAGFIGFHLSQKLLDNGLQVTGLDNLRNVNEIRPTY
jgi:UDP-glucuronate 4-epimerase